MPKAEDRSVSPGRSPGPGLRTLRTGRRLGVTTAVRDMDTLSPVAAGFAPSAEEVRWARAVLGAGDSVTTVDGRGHDSRVAPVGVPARRPSLRVVSSFGCRPGMSRDSARPGACPSLPRSPGPDRERPGAEAAAERRQRAPAPVVACGLARGAGVVQGGEIRNQDRHPRGRGRAPRPLTRLGDRAPDRPRTRHHGDLALRRPVRRRPAGPPSSGRSLWTPGPGGPCGRSVGMAAPPYPTRLPRRHGGPVPSGRLQPRPQPLGTAGTSQIAMVECGLGVTVVPAAASASPPPSGSGRSATRRRPSNSPP